MNRTLLPVLLVTFCIPFPIYANDMEGMKHDMSEMRMQSSPNAENAAYDHQFIDTMMQHHKMAMHMAKMAEPKVVNPELKDKIRMMLDEQKAELNELKSLKQKLYVDKGEAINMKMPGMMPMQSMEMKELMSARGEDFDDRFVMMMNKHHKGGITMAQREISRGKQSDVKELARKIKQSQEKDIADMTKMKKEWSSRS